MSHALSMLTNAAGFPGGGVMAKAMTITPNPRGAGPGPFA